MRIPHLIAIGLIMVASCLTVSAAEASTYYFSGTCVDCTGAVSGTSLVTGTLQLINDSAGQPLDASNFLSFSYDGSDKANAFTLDPADDFITFSATFAAQPSQFATVTIQGTTDATTTDPSNGDTANWQYTFTTGNDGSFDLSIGYVNEAPGSTAPTGPANNVDRGTVATWTLADDATAVPEAPSLWLLAAGIIALTLTRASFSRWNAFWHSTIDHDGKYTPTP